MHPNIKTARSSISTSADDGTYSAGKIISICAHRDASPPWKLQEFSVFKARVERITERAVLLVDILSKSRKSVWVPKSLLALAKADEHGSLTHSYLVGHKLEGEAGFTIDVVYDNEGGLY